MKVDQPLPFDVRFKITTYYTEWDDRYDPPQEITYENSDVTILYFGQLESSHQSHNSGSSGSSNNSGTYVKFIINQQDYKGGEPFVIDGKQYIIKGVKI